MLAETFVRAEGAFPLIGAGGIDSGATAIAKIKAGATLIQLYTGLVFRGVGLVGEIKADLLAALKRGAAICWPMVGTRRRRDHRGKLAGARPLAPASAR